MKNLLNEEQLSYLKSLESKKKRRKFLLDCLVESVIGESGKIKTSKLSDFPSTQINEHVKVFHTNTTAPRTFEGVLKNEANELLKFDLPKEQLEINLICEVQDYLKSINIFIEANQVKKLESIFLKYNESANSEKKYTEEDVNKILDDFKAFLKYKEKFLKFLEND